MVEVKLFSFLKIILVTVAFLFLITSVDFKVKHWCYSFDVARKVLTW